MCADPATLTFLLTAGTTAAALKSSGSSSKPSSAAVQPKSSREGVEGRDAKRRIRGAAGTSANIFTSALGDSGFGSNVKSATKLGQTS